MSLAALSGFAQGLGAGMDMKKRRAEKAEDNARQDRLLSIYERAPAGYPSYGGVPGQQEVSGGRGAAPGGAGQGGELLDIIDRSEGGANYDTLFGHSQNGGRFNGVRVSEMTLGELYRFTDPSGEYGRWVGANNPKGAVATPTGRFQIVGTTMRRTAQQMGLPDDTVYSPAVQVAMAEHLARNRLNGLSSPAAKRAAMRSEWDGFRSVADADLDRAIASFEASGGRLMTRPRGVGKAPI